MPESEPKEPSPKESIALPYDPGKAPPLSQMVTSPLRPFDPDGGKGSRSPVFIVVGAIILLGILVLGVFLASSEEAPQEFSLREVAAPLCNVTAQQEISVRTEPSFDAPRAWITSQGQTLQAVEQYQGDWLRLLNGWVPRQNLELTPLEACDALPETRTPISFNDDLPALNDNWPPILEESFATDDRGWVASVGDPSQAAIREGYLVLFSPDQTQLPLAFPSESSNETRTVGDAYYTFQVLWVASDLDAGVVLTFGESQVGAYQLVVGRDGGVQLFLQPTGGQAMPITERSSTLTFASDEFIVGLLRQDDAITVYANGEEVLTTEDGQLGEGTFSVGLRGQQSTIYIRRFEVLNSQN